MRRSRSLQKHTADARVPALHDAAPAPDTSDVTVTGASERRLAVALAGMAQATLASGALAAVGLLAALLSAVMVGVVAVVVAALFVSAWLLRVW